MAHPQLLPAVATALLGTAAAVSVSHHFQSNPGALQLPDCAGAGVATAHADLKPGLGQIPGASEEEESTVPTAQEEGTEDTNQHVTMDGSGDLGATYGVC